MIAYTRTTDAGAGIISDALGNILHMIINSVRSRTKTVVYSELEAIEYDLSKLERIQYFKMPAISKVLIIRKSDLQSAQINELLANISDVEWTVIDSVNHHRNEYSYQQRNGDIIFKLRLMRENRVFRT